jgi:hypothetical protein
MWRAAASSQTRPSIGSVVPPSAARAFTTPKQNASYERRLNCWVIELLPCHIFVTSIRFVTPIQLSTRKWVNWPSRRNRGRRRRAPSPLPPHGRIVVLDGHQFGVEVIGLSADQRS